MKKLAVPMMGILIVIMMVAAGICLNVQASRACGKTVTCMLFNLRIRDQDESWGDGVRDTWSVVSMEPGEEYPFSSSFVQLKQLGFIVVHHLDVTMDYSLRGGCAEGMARLSGDDMAGKMQITRLEYYTGDWKINLLTGAFTGNPPRPIGFHSGDWSIADVDGDGTKSFRDFQDDPVLNLPPPQFWKADCSAPIMKMSVKFSEEAGNECMNACFDFSVSYTASLCCRR